MLSNTIVFISAFIISYLISKFFVKNISNFKLYRIFSRERSNFDKDGREILKVGGLIIFISTMLALFIVSLFKGDLEINLIDFKKTIGFATGAAIMLMLGIFDDAVKVRYGGKFIWQAIATSPLVLSGYNIYRISFFGRTLEVYWVGYLLLVFWILLITNAMNLIDGLDGLACGVAIITFSALAIISHTFYPTVVLLCLAYIGSLLAFLRFNFYPAKLYLGDNGSLLLGFTLAVISLEINVKMNTLTMLALPVLILMLPIGSAVYSFSRRIGRGKNPFVADKLHLHHLLLNSGVPYILVVLLFWISSIVLAMLGVISYFLNRRFEFFMLSLGVLVLVISYGTSMIIIRQNRNK